MFKKIIAGIIVTGLAGALVIGAAARTAALTSRDGSVQNQGRNRPAEVGRGGLGQQGNQAGNGGAGGHGQRSQAGDGNGESGGYQGNNAQGGNGNRQGGDRQANAAAYANEWLTLSGTVLSVDANALVVGLEGGEQIVVDGRAWSYAQEQGFTAQSGDTLILTGFYDGDTFEVGQIENLTQQISVTLRDDTGRPQWAGGRGNGNR